MKTCSKCGAENLQTAASCRMCAMPLEAPESKLGVHAEVPLGEIPPSVLVSGAEPAHQHAPAAAYGGHIICQSCKAVNEADYVFCEQCGARLTRPVPPTGERPAPAFVSPLPQTPSAAEGRHVSGSQPMRSEQASERAVHPAAPAGERPSRSRGDRHAVTAEQPLEEFDRGRQPEVGGPRELARNAVGSGRPTHDQSSAKVVCEHCGNTQPSGGLYCGICGSVLTPTGSGRRIAGSRRGAFLELITETSDERETYPVKGEVVLGRVDGDVTFSHDGYMSGRHARIVERDGRYFLIDEGSRNGTFIRINGEVEIKNGDVFLIGKQVLRFEKG